jgi:hypothetical protein
VVSHSFLSACGVIKLNSKTLLPLAVSGELKTVLEGGGHGPHGRQDAFSVSNVSVFQHN